MQRRKQNFPQNLIYSKHTQAATTKANEWFFRQRNFHLLDFRFFVFSLPPNECKVRFRRIIVRLNLVLVYFACIFRPYFIHSHNFDVWLIIMVFCFIRCKKYMRFRFDTTCMNHSIMDVQDTDKNIRIRREFYVFA